MSRLKDFRARRHVLSSTTRGGSEGSQSALPGSEWLTLQRQVGNRAVSEVLMRAQRLGETEPEPRPMPFPHASTIVAATGAPIPGAAMKDASACADLDVPAFTVGLVSTFASATPTVHVAAHEATHQLQHSGVTRDQGSGAEGHASAVAGLVASGRSARDHIGAAGAAVPRGVRPYTEVSEAQQQASGAWAAGGTAKVADDGRTVTTNADKHLCYADPVLIVESQQILKAKKSGIHIAPGAPGPGGQAPDGSGAKSTVKVGYTILTDENSEEFFADCGYSAREVQGPTGTDTSPQGVYIDNSGQRATTARSKDPAGFRDEILVQAGLGHDPVSANAAYHNLSDAEKDTFDKKHGINRYAAPGVGEAFTRRRDDAVGGTGFNFHWGGVIMVAGGDRVTFENYTKGEGYTAVDDDWYFATYGPPTKPGQTWHEQWKSVGGEGKGHTMAAATSADPSAFTKGAATMSTADAINAYNTSSDEGEKMALESELRDRWLKVTVLVKKAQEGTDEVYVTAKHAGREYESGNIDLSSGDKNTFWVSLGRLFPISGKISIKVYDSDVISDDVISTLAFDTPYTPQSDNRPWDDAIYHTTVEFNR